MISGSGSRYGLTQAQANDAIDVLSLNFSNRGPGPESITIFAGASGLPPSNPTITIQLFPTGKIAVGTDSNGDISVTTTLANTGDDKTYGVSGGGFVTFPEGFWESQLRSITSAPDPSAGTRWFIVQFSAFDPNDPAEFVEDAAFPAPTDLQATTPVFDPETGQYTLDLTWTDNSSDEDGFLIITEPSPSGFEYTEGSVPTDDEIFHERFVNEDPPVEEWLFYVKGYKYELTPPHKLTPPAGPIVVDFGVSPDPDINMTMDGGLSVGGSATIVFIGDASGIYTLVPGKTHDTLYERTDVDFQNVAIPNPFVKTAFLG